MLKYLCACNLQPSCSSFIQNALKNDMMDYKYIEQLLERYWECQTTLEEEGILQMFFAQDSVPAHLLPYRVLFIAEREERRQTRLGKDFDERLMRLAEQDAPVKAVSISLSQRLRPFFRAAAVIAIILTLGSAVQRALEPDEADVTAQRSFSTLTKQGPSVAVSDSVRKDSVTLGHAPNNVLMK